MYIYTHTHTDIDYSLKNIPIPSNESIGHT